MCGYATQGEEGGRRRQGVIAEYWCPNLTKFCLLVAKTIVFMIVKVSSLSYVFCQNAQSIESKTSG